jgi:hypothetical protein
MRSFIASIYAQGACFSNAFFAACRPRSPLWIEYIFVHEYSQESLIWSVQRSCVVGKRLVPVTDAGLRCSTNLNEFHPD